MIDLNVLLDFLQKRQPHYDASARLLNKVLFGEIAGVLPAHAITTLHYLIAKHAGETLAGTTVDWMLRRFEVAPCDKEIFFRARALAFGDFEDAVVAALAEREACDAIATRNPAHFVVSPVAAMEPEALLSRLSRHSRPPEG